MAKQTMSVATRERAITDINDLYGRWRQAWLNFPDIKLMLSLFDKQFSPVLYQAEEIPSGLTTYAEIEDYWQNAHKLLAGISEWQEVSKSISLLTPEAAILWAEVMTAIKTTVLPQNVCGKLRCSLGVRKGDQGWSIVHYHESRQLLAEQDKSGNWKFLVDLTLK